MNRWIESCVRVVCLPGCHEELLGDLTELRAHTHTGKGARVWLDIASILLYQCRIRGWGPREWSGAALAAAAVVAVIGAAPIAASHPTSYSFDGRDAAGVFTLELRDREVLETVSSSWGPQFELRLFSAT